MIEFLRLHSRSRIWCGLIGFALLAVLQVFAAYAASLEPVGSIGGPRSGVAVDGSLICVGEGASLALLDATSTTHPLLLGRVALKRFPYAISVSGSLVAVAELDQGVQLVDISNPAAPVVCANIAYGWESITNVALVGSNLIIGNPLIYPWTNLAVAVYDVSTRNQPMLLGTVALDPYEYTFTVVKNSIYLYGPSGFRVFDISDLSPYTVVADFPTSVGIRALAESGSYAYAVPGTYKPAYPYVPDDTTTPTLYILDIADAAHPLLIAQVPYGASLFAHQPLGDPGYSLNSVVAGNYLVIGDNLGRLVFFDVSNPMSPVYKGIHRPTLQPASYEYWRNSKLAAISPLLVAVTDGYMEILDPSTVVSGCVKDYWSTPDHVYATDIEGALLYAAMGESGLGIFDVADPTSPVTVGAWSRSAAFDVSASGTSAAVISSTSTVTFLDVSDPHNPSFHGKYDAPPIPTNRYPSLDVCLAQGVAYLLRNYPYQMISREEVEYRESHLDVLDYASSSTPTVVHSEFRGEWDSGFLKSSGEYLMATSFSDSIGWYDLFPAEFFRFAIGTYDISSPLAPRLISRDSYYEYGGVPFPYHLDSAIKNEIELTANAYGIFSLIPNDHSNRVMSGYYDNIEVRGDRAVADDQTGVNILDVSDAQFPRHLGTAILQNPQGRTDTRLIDERWAYVRSDTETENRFAILDTSGFVPPDLKYHSDYFTARWLSVSGTLAATHSLRDQIAIVDFSNPSKPKIVSTIYLPAPTKRIFQFTPTNLVLENSTLFATNDGNLEIYDVSNLSHPTPLGFYPYPDDSPESGFLDIAVSQPYAYLVDSSSLWVLDCTDPTSPTLAAHLSGVPALHIQVNGNRAYVSYASIIDSEPLLTIIDLSDPHEPVTVGSIDNVYYFVTEGNLLFSLIGSYAVDAFDVSDPSSPVELGAVYYGNTINGLAAGAVSNGYLFVYDPGAGLWVIDVSHPGAMSIASNCIAYGSSYSDDSSRVSVSGDLVILAKDRGGLEIVRFPNLLTHPEENGWMLH